MENLAKLLSDKRRLRRVLNEMSLADAEICLMKIEEIVSERRAEEERLAAEEAEKSRKINEMRELLAQSGLSVEDLGAVVAPSRRSSSRQGVKVEPKYQWTTAEGIVKQWTGRGNTPRDLKQLLEQGASLEQFLIG